MSKNNEKSYDEIASEWGKNRENSPLNKYVEKLANLVGRNRKVLDVGCGAGLPNAGYLVGNGHELVGIDVSSKLLEQARKNVPNATFVESDIVDFKTDEKFDGVIAWDSLFHLELDEHEKVFEKIALLLKADGYFLFTHGGGKGGIREGQPMFGKPFSYSSPGETKIKVILKRLGFKVLDWVVDKEDYLIALVRKQ